MKKNKIGIHKLLGFKTYYIPGQVAQLVGALSRAPKRVAGLIPGQGTYLGCKFNPQSGCVWEATDRCFYLSLFLSLFLSLTLFLSKIKSVRIFFNPLQN